MTKLMEILLMHQAAPYKKIILVCLVGLVDMLDLGYSSEEQGFKFSFWYKKILKLPMPTYNHTNKIFLINNSGFEPLTFWL